MLRLLCLICRLNQFIRTSDVDLCKRVDVNCRIEINLTCDCAESKANKHDPACYKFILDLFDVIIDSSTYENKDSASKPNKSQDQKSNLIHFFIFSDCEHNMKLIIPLTWINSRVGTKALINNQATFCKRVKDLFIQQAPGFKQCSIKTCRINVWPSINVLGVY